MSERVARTPVRTRRRVSPSARAHACLRPMLATDNDMAPAARVVRRDIRDRCTLDLPTREGILRSDDGHAIGASWAALADAGLGRYPHRLSVGDDAEHARLAAVATRIPRAVFCLLSALHLHGLTTQPPRDVWIAMPSGSHVPRVDHLQLQIVRAFGDAYVAGIETIERGHVPLRVHAVAKTVADCFKHRNRVGLEVALEALREVRTQQKASVAELWHYAKICRVARVMHPYLTVIG